MTRTTLRFYLNGQPIALDGACAFQSLSDFLRYERTLMGTKIVCEEGDCGACTVLIGRALDGQIHYRTANACIQYLYQLDATHIITVEGLRDDNALTPVQQAMVDHFGSQCGFCTPGFVMSLTDLFYRHSSVTESELRYALSGNLCRCTGYTPILEAGFALNGQTCPPLSQRYSQETMRSELEAMTSKSVLLTAVSPSSGVSSSPSTRTVFIPATLDEALRYKEMCPEAIPLAGGTDLGVQMNKRGLQPERVLCLVKVRELTNVAVDNGQLIVGGGATWIDCESVMRDLCAEFYQILTIFGSPQIRNVGTIAGNLANASPIADSLPFLYAIGAQIELASVRGRHLLPIEQFYLGYKQLNIALDEIITRVAIPLPKSDQILKLYRLSKRKGMDIATFGAGILMTHQGDTITRINIAYGGVGPTVLRLPKTEAFLAGKPFTLATMQAAGEIAQGEISPLTDVRATQEYRLLLAQNILVKFYYEVASSESAPPALTIT